MLLCLLALGAALAGPRIAVVDLQNKTGDTTLDGAGAGVSGVLVSKLTNVDTLEVVERERLDSVLDELQLGQSGVIDPATAARAGKVLGASHLVMGEIASVKLPTVAITLRVVEVGSGKVVAASDVVGQVGTQGEEFFVLVDDVAMKVIEALHVKLGAKDRIELSQVQAERFETVSLYGSALRALDSGDRVRAHALLSRAIAIEPGFHLADDALKRLAQQVAASRTELAAAAVQRVHAGWDAMERVTAGELPAAPSVADLAKAALRARMRLVRGDPQGYLMLETERLARTKAEHAAARETRSAFDAEVRALREQAGAPHASLDDIPLDAPGIRKQMTLALLSLGRREAAAAMLTEAFGPPDPWDVEGQYALASAAKALSLHDLEVVAITTAARALGALPGEQPRAPVPGATDPGDLGRALVSVMLVDGVAAPGEQRAVDEAFARHGLPPLGESEHRVWTPEDLRARRSPPPRFTFAEPRVVVEALCAVMDSDSKRDDRERALVGRFERAITREFEVAAIEASREQERRYRYTPDRVLRELDEAVKRVEQTRAARERIDTLHRAIRGHTGDRAPLSKQEHADRLLHEVEIMTSLTPNGVCDGVQKHAYDGCSRADPELVLVAHNAFLERVRGGFYATVQGDPALRDLWTVTVHAWASKAMLPWYDPWYADQKVAAWMATMDLLPPTDEASRKRRDEEVRALIASVYGN